MTLALTRALTRARLMAWAPALMIAAVILIHLPTFDQPLVEIHSWRQAQTAYTARIFHEEGIDLFHSKLPVLGPPWEVPFEFPAFQAAAALVMDVGVPEDRAMRLTAFATFLVAAGLLWWFARRYVGRLGAIVALAAFLFSPLALLWSRIGMIDYLAVDACLAFVLAGLRWREDGRPRWFVVAFLAGSLAMAVKLPSALFWVVPFALLGYPRDPDRPDLVADGRGTGPASRWRDAAAWVLSLGPAAVGVAWTRYADGIKAASPWTAGQTSGALAEWDFGYLVQRLDPLGWITAPTPTLAYLGGLVVLPAALFAVGYLAVEQRRRRLWLWIGLASLAPSLVFLNLYIRHEYYAIALSPAVALVLGGAATWAAGQWRRPPIRVVAAVAVVAWLLAIPAFAGLWARMYEPVGDVEGVLPRAAQIATATRPDDRVAIIGWNWSPALLYYAHRWGLAVVPEKVTEALPGELAAEGYLVFRCTEPLDPDARCERIVGGLP